MELPVRPLQTHQMQSSRCSLPVQSAGSWAPLRGVSRRKARRTSGKTHKPRPPSLNSACANCRSSETWLKISLNAKLSLKPLDSAPLEMGHQVKIETFNHLVFLSFMQLCCWGSEFFGQINYIWRKSGVVGGFFRMKFGCSSLGKKNQDHLKESRKKTLSPNWVKHQGHHDPLCLVLGQLRSELLRHALFSGRIK